MTMFTDEVVVRFFADTKGSEKAFGKLISVTRTLHKGVEKTTEVFKDNKGVLREVTTQTKKSSAAMASAGKKAKTFHREIRDLNKGLFRTGDSFGRIIAKVTQWTIATGAVFGTLAAIKKSLGIMKDFE